MEACIMVFEGGVFNFLKKLNLSRIPTIGEKIVTEDRTGCSWVFKVVDVHFADYSKTDIFVTKGENITDYLISLGSTQIEI